MNEPQKNYADLKKQDINNYILYDSLYISTKSPEKTHVQRLEAGH